MPPTSPSLLLRRPEPDTLELCLAGDWVVGGRTPRADEALNALAGEPAPRRVRFDCRELSAWDSVLLTFLLQILNACEANGIESERQGLPKGVRGMLNLALAVPERQDLGRRPEPRGVLALVGRHTLNIVEDFLRLAEFTGEATLAFGRMLLGRARFRASDLWRLIQDCGPNALPIISLISLLVGMILAFIGAVQLRMFGAQIYIADLVGLGMAREMGAMMTAILMAGRTGAAFAAELGSMQVNDELDAFKTSGFAPMEFLVLPRILALFLATPFLCLYADVLGMVGGAVVASSMFDISFPEYFAQIRNRLTLTDFSVGIVKGAVFGILVAAAGCMRGLQCGRSSTAVGLVTTSAVVTGIVFIIVADAIMNLIVTALNVYQR
jgi:phospholipid/cholesterol/gamma-HCH transport system permease protein